MLDVKLANKPKSFHRTGFVDFHELFISYLNAFIKKKLRLNTYISSSLYELDQELPKGQMYQNDSDPCDTFSNFYRLVVDKNGPLKFKNVPLMTKELSD